MPRDHWQVARSPANPSTVTTRGRRRPRTHSRWAEAAAEDLPNEESQAGGGARGARRPGSPEAAALRATRQRGLQDPKHPGEVRAGRRPCHRRIAPVDAACCHPPPAPALCREMGHHSSERSHSAIVVVSKAWRPFVLPLKQAAVRSASPSLARNVRVPRDRERGDDTRNSRSIHGHTLKRLRRPASRCPETCPLRRRRASRQRRPRRKAM